MEAAGNSGALAEEVRERAAEAIDSLGDTRHRPVLLGRLGLGESDGPLTLNQIGLELGVSRERVRQLQEKGRTRLVTQARRVGTDGAVLAAILDEELGDRSDPDYPARILDLATEAFATSPRVGVPLLLSSAGVGLSEAKSITTQTTLLLASRAAALKAAPTDQRVAKANRWLENWLDQADWPSQLSQPPTRTELHAQREIEMDELSGKYWSAKLGRNVLFESGLERDVLDALETSERVAYYQEQPCAIDYEYNGMPRRYYPDVVVVTEDGRTLLMEVKPLHEIPLSINRAKGYAARRVAHRLGWGWVTTNGPQTAHYLASLAIRNESATAIRSALERRGSLTWREVKWLRQAHGVTSAEVSAYVYQRQLHLQHAPYQLGG